MPIYMDRHDLPDAVTAEAVAKVHQEDLKVQDQYGCRVLTYWFDEVRKTAFCLVDAPEKEAVCQMHNVAHGMIPNRIVEVDSNVVNAFLGRIEDSVVPDHSNGAGNQIIKESAYRTILISKIEDFAILKAKLGNDKISSFTDRLDDLIRQSAQRNSGREVKKMRDGFIISFSSCANALDCAMEIHDNFAVVNFPEFQLRIGLSAGSPVTDNPAFFGQSVEQAKRFCNVMRSGQIMISAEIMEQMLEEFPGTFSGKKITALNQKDEEFLNHLVDVTESYWDQTGFDVNRFAMKLGMSKAQLYRRLMNLCSFSPNNFLKEYRLKKALEAMEKQQGNVAEITYKCGFSSPSYFSKCFLERFGILPSAFATSLI